MVYKFYAVKLKSGSWLSYWGGATEDFRYVMLCIDERTAAQFCGEEDAVVGVEVSPDANH